MSKTLASEPGPISGSPPDDTDQLQALARSLELAKGFTLLFAQCDSPDIRQHFVSGLKERLPGLNIAEVHFSRPVSSLVDELSIRTANATPSAVFVSGLENSISSTPTARSGEFLWNLNASRSSFSSAFPFPLVLWVPEHVFAAITRGAPDFFSVRSGVYFFSQPPQRGEMEKDLLLIDDEDWWVLSSLINEEKSERLQTRERLLEGFSSLGPSGKDVVREVRLRREAGHLSIHLEMYENARRHYESLRTLARERGRRDVEALATYELGILEIWRERLQEAKINLEACLNLFREVGDKKNEGSALRALGICYAKLEMYSDALERLEEAESVSRQAGDPVGEGRASLGQAEVLGTTGSAQKAEDKARQSLSIFRAAQAASHEAVALLVLGRVLAAKGESNEAEESYKRSREIAHKLGYAPLLLRSLDKLGALYRYRGRYEEADACYQEYAAISKEHGELRQEAFALSNLSSIHEAKGDYRGALQFSQDSANLFNQVSDQRAVYDVQEDVARLKRRLEAATS